jgi:hypothetical protein
MFFRSGAFTALLAASMAAAIVLAASREAAAFSNAAISGKYAFSWSISGSCADRSEAIGLLAFSSGNISSSSQMTVYDTNSGSPTVTQFMASGTYSVRRNGTGTMKVQNISDGTTSNFSFVLYEVNFATLVAKHVELLQTDLRNDNCEGKASLTHQ